MTLEEAIWEIKHFLPRLEPSPGSGCPRSQWERDQERFVDALIIVLRELEKNKTVATYGTTH